MMPTENKEIKAVHVTDLENLLKKYEQLEDFNSGDMKCQICSDIVSSKNAGSVKLTNNRLAFTCNKVSCYNQIVKNTQ